MVLSPSSHGDISTKLGWRSLSESAGSKTDSSLEARWSSERSKEVGALPWDVPTVVGSEQRLHIHLPPRNVPQRKRPCPIVLDAVSTETAAKMYHPVEQTHNHDCGDGVSI